MRKIKKPLTIIILIASLILPQVNLLPVKAQSTDFPVYIVQSGDTLYSIALRFNLTLEEILTVNQSIDPDYLNIGDQINISGLDGITGVLSFQTVPFGASLTSLSRKHQVQIDSLTNLNKLTSPVEVFAGAQIIIPLQNNSIDQIPIDNNKFDLSSVELAAINKINPWTIQKNNALPSTWQFLPNEIIFVSTDEQEENSLGVPFIEEFEINSLPLVQGATVGIKFRTSESITPHAELLGKDLPFYSENENEYISLFGVSAIADPGVYPLTLEFENLNETSYRFEQWVILQEAGFINDPEIYVTPESVDPDIIAAEEIIFESYISGHTPTRYWDDIFWPPVGDRTCIVGYYGNRRSYNDGALLYYHTGIDYGYCTGIEVFAPAKGIVVATESDLTVRGNALIIDHGWGVYTGYWHLDEFLVNVGDVVSPGQLIAYMGNTGRSAGPHLHFELIVNGVAVNPETWLIKEFP